MTTPFIYDPTRLVPQYSHFHQRLAYVHPSSPSTQALGYPTIFMGWTPDEARAACAHANAAMTFIECGCCGAYHRSTYYGDCRNDLERFADIPADAIIVENETHEDH